MSIGPYAGISKDNPEQSALLAKNVIETSGKVLLWEVDGIAVGLLAFIVYDHYFSGEKTAIEMIWFVLPEHRTGAAALRLLWAAQDLAKEMGAKKMQFTAPTETVGQLYKRFGYKQIEVCYQKELR